jgi:hypothetical protein
MDNSSNRTNRNHLLTSTIRHNNHTRNNVRYGMIGVGPLTQTRAFP